MKNFQILALAVLLLIASGVANAGKDLKLVYFDGHIHTTHSDGSGTIADVKQAAVARGLDAVIITNHTEQIVDMNEWMDIVDTCKSLSDSNFKMIPSFEVTGSEGLLCRDHVLAWGVGCPFVGNPTDALAPEEVWESPMNPNGTGALYPAMIREWTDWIHENGGIAVHAHSTGTTQLDYNVDFIELINLSYIKDIRNFAMLAGYPASDALGFGILLNNFAIYGDRDLQMPIQLPGVPYPLPLQTALYLATERAGSVGEVTGGVGQWLGAPNAAPLNSWDDLLMAYINGEIDHPVYGVANSDSHNTANVDFGNGNPAYDNSDVGEAKNGVFVKNFNQGQLFKAIRHGNLFATTGPSMYFEINGEIMGETVTYLPNMEKTAKLTLSADAQIPNHIIVKVDIIKNGEILRTANPMVPTFELVISDPVTKDGYYRVEVTSIDMVTGMYRFAYSNPVFVEFKSDTLYVE